MNNNSRSTPLFIHPRRRRPGVIVRRGQCDWLSKAIAIAGKKEIRIMALDDPDLEPMWTRIGEI